MSTTVLVIVFVVALVFSLGFLLLVFAMIPAIQQLKSTLLDLELDQSKRTVESAGEALHFISQNVLRRSAGLLAFLPAVKIGWNLIKKIKGGNK
jgi:hypothetical protein